MSTTILITGQAGEFREFKLRQKRHRGYVRLLSFNLQEWGVVMRTWIIGGALFVGHCVLLAAGKPIDHVNGTVRATLLFLLIVGALADLIEFLFGKSD